MKKAFLLLTVVVALLLHLHTDAHAIPKMISYQGVLNDANGSPISSTVSMTFRIYDIESGGTSLWTETQNVQVSNGVFNVKLGSANEIPAEVFDQDDLYIGIQIGSDTEMVPRQQITSGSFVYKAAHADMASEIEQIIIPIGSIIAWAKSISGTPALPEGWVECNGQTLSDPDSPISGQNIPDLNGQKRFLRGNSISGGTGGSTEHSHRSAAGSGGFNNSPSQVITDTQNHLPPYFDVVWIMKIK